MASVAGAPPKQPPRPLAREENKSMSRRRAAFAMMLALCLVLIESTSEDR
jgi:hypothetical protein